MTMLHGCGTARVDKPSRKGLTSVFSPARFMRSAKYARAVASKSFLLWWQASRLQDRQPLAGRVTDATHVATIPRHHFRSRWRSGRLRTVVERDRREDAGRARRHL